MDFIWFQVNLLNLLQDNHHHNQADTRAINPPLFPVSPHHNPPFIQHVLRVNPHVYPPSFLPVNRQNNPVAHPPHDPLNLVLNQLHNQPQNRRTNLLHFLRVHLPRVHPPCLVIHRVNAYVLPYSTPYFYFAIPCRCPAIPYPTLTYVSYCGKRRRVIWWTIRFITCWLIHQSSSFFLNHPPSFSITLFPSQSPSFLLNQSTHPSINQSINQSMNQSINPPINQSINPPINQSIN